MNYELRIKKQKNKGFTLVETLVAIAIFSISILSILSVLASSITDVTYAKEKTIAGYLAQEGIEYMRNIRDNDVLYPANNSSWANFTNTAINSSLASCTSSAPCGFDAFTTPTNSIQFFSCSSDPSEGSNGCFLLLNSNGVYDDNADQGGVTNPGFQRKVWMTVLPGGNEVQISSGVYWKQGTTSASVIFTENLFNWQS